MEQIEKWRRQHIENKKHTLLSEETKENYNLEDLDQIDMKDKVNAVYTSDHEQTEEESPEFQCMSCGKIYASEWVKCPNCLRRDTVTLKAKSIFNTDLYI